MPEQFVVPQFIDAEDKIIGPITVRQFVILLVTGLMIFTLYSLLSFIWFLVFGIPTFAMGMVIAFVRVNGQPFHFFLLNIIQTFRKPRLRVWSKTNSDAELKAYMISEPPAPSDRFKRKQFAKSSRLHEISLVVNTGGVYVPEE
jgi:hypothetical protein